MAEVLKVYPDSIVPLSIAAGFASWPRKGRLPKKIISNKLKSIDHLTPVLPKRFRSASSYGDFSRPMVFPINFCGHNFPDFIKAGRFIMVRPEFGQKYIGGHEMR